MNARYFVAMIVLLANTFPCMSQRIQYDFEMGREPFPGDVVLEWKIDPGARHSQEQVKDTTKFVVRITSMFDELILRIQCLKSVTGLVRVLETISR